MGQVYKITGAEAASTFDRAVEAYLAAHTVACAWADGTATKYRQSLTALAARLADGPVGADIAALAPRRQCGAHRRVHPGVRDHGPAHPGAAPVHRAFGLRLVARQRAMADTRPHRRLGPPGDFRRHHPGAHFPRPLADPVDRAHGWTLHQLRHFVLTTKPRTAPAPATLLARSRHTSVHSLAGYCRPGPASVGAYVAATNPAPRRRR